MHDRRLFCLFSLLLFYMFFGRSVIEQRVLYLGHSQIIRRDVRVHFAPLSVCAHMLKYGHTTSSVLTHTPLARPLIFTLTLLIQC